jgi:hypothetical protein
MKTAVSLTLFALVATASAEIDAGGGRSAVGTMTNHALIGAIVASTPQTAGSLTLRSGVIEVLDAASGPSTPRRTPPNPMKSASINSPLS